MKISFKHRISGLARIAYATKELEVVKYRVLRYGDEYVSFGKIRKQICNLALECIMLNGSKVVYELKPNSRVNENDNECNF